MKKVCENLREILKAAHRSSALSRQLLAFARKQPVNPQILSINNSIEGMLKMLRRMIGEDVKLLWEPGDNLWPVKIDPGRSIKFLPIFLLTPEMP